MTRQTDGIGPSSETKTVGSDFPEGSVIIPAHNEEAVLGRTLSSLAPAVATGLVDVVVVCNGCTDRTVEVARRYAAVRIVEIHTASKTAALNAGDAIATRFPRLYLDADIAIGTATLRALFEALDASGPRAARAPYRYDVGGASPLVRAYYRARRRLPVRSTDLWGAGAFAVNRAGRGLFGPFPELVADDLFVSLVFGDEVKVSIDAEPVLVRTPPTTKDLFAVVRRANRGNRQLAHHPAGSVIFDHTSVRATVVALLRSVSGPRSLIDASAYAAIAVAARASVVLGGDRGWERDEGSRDVRRFA